MRLIISVKIKAMFYGVIIDVILSWTDLYRRNRSLLFIKDFADAVNNPARKIVPPVNGLDLAPMVTLIALELIARFI